MNNLLDGIRRFKLVRQMASKPADAQDEIDGLVKMYEAIDPEDETLKHKFSKRWDKLSEAKRPELVERLLNDGLLPSNIRQALEIFNGKVVALV